MLAQRLAAARVVRLPLLYRSNQTDAPEGYEATVRKAPHELLAPVNPENYTLLRLIRGGELTGSNRYRDRH